MKTSFFAFLFWLCITTPALAQEAWTDPTTGITFTETEYYLNSKRHKGVVVSFDDLLTHLPGFAMVPYPAYGSGLSISNYAITTINGTAIKSLNDIKKYYKSNPQGRVSVGLINMKYGIYASFSFYINFPNATPLAVANGQCIWGDCLEGRSQLKYADGTILSGEFVKGKPNRFCAITSPTGHIAVGSYKEDGTLAFVLIKTPNDEAFVAELKDNTVYRIYWKDKFQPQIHFSVHEWLSRKWDFLPYYYPKAAIPYTDLFGKDKNSIMALMKSDAEALETFTGEKNFNEQLMMPFPIVTLYNCQWKEKFTNGQSDGVPEILFTTPGFSSPSYKMIPNAGKMMVKNNRISGNVVIYNQVNNEWVFTGYLANDTLQGYCNFSTGSIYNMPSKGNINAFAKNGMLVGGYKVEFANAEDYKYNYADTLEKPATVDEFVTIVRNMHYNLVKTKATLSKQAQDYFEQGRLLDFTVKSFTKTNPFNMGFYLDKILSGDAGNVQTYEYTAYPRAINPEKYMVIFLVPDKYKVNTKVQARVNYVDANGKPNQKIYATETTFSDLKNGVIAYKILGVMPADMPAEAGASLTFIFSSPGMDVFPVRCLIAKTQ